LISGLNKDGDFPLGYLESPNPRFLRQGDVLRGVPLFIAPSAIRYLEKPHAEGSELRATILPELRYGDTAYTIVQVTLGDAIILTYDCDIDSSLSAVKAGQAPDANDLITVAAAVELTDYHKANLGHIAAGRMPRFVHLPASTSWPARIIDFTTIQQVDMRVLLPRVPERMFGLNDGGQLRLVEVFDDAIGGPFRRKRVGPDDPNLLADAYKAFTGMALPS
jgi:hypothetical protein